MTIYPVARQMTNEVVVAVIEVDLNSAPLLRLVRAQAGWELIHEPRTRLLAFQF